MEREQCMKAVKGDEVDLGQSTISASQSDITSLARRLTWSTFEASISPLIEITVSPRSVFARTQAPSQSNVVVPL
ncbi:hypothetical protein [Mycolicibacterium moriokaense]|uniref:hypothetical protein n=1 Tax=Mycolicibacterium moriokaense TaxID=39691 RepID=UPI0011B3BAF3|nr:hypothetical protein [Mycolicibacterium moriokaense]